MFGEIKNCTLPTQDNCPSFKACQTDCLPAFCICRMPMMSRSTWWNALLVLSGMMMQLKIT